MISDFMQFLGSGSIDFVGFLLSLMPQAPDFMTSLRGFVNDHMRDAFGVFNWFVPVSGIVTLLGAWISCCVLYIVVRWAVSSFGGKG